MGALTALDQFYELFREIYPQDKEGKIQNRGRQANQFVRLMQIGDWVAMPSKRNPVIHFGKIKGPYTFHPSATDPYFHSRKVEWFAQDTPRDRFDQDILYSFGAFLTVCRIAKNDAEARIKAMAANHWKALSVSSSIPQEEAIEGQDDPNIAETAADQIARTILAKFKGHGLARLVKAILEAQDYEVFMSPEGPDKGVDLLAAPGNLGFGEPRICVQVKATDTPIERVVLDQLNGVMQDVGAQKGLLVSWGGFKKSIEQERATKFFRVRLWDRDEILTELFRNYDRLDPSIKAELPLKQIWVLAKSEEA
jgi:restriction system protein